MPVSASEMLCANLLQGIHAAAEPLTILRATLGKGAIRDGSEGSSAAERRVLAESSAMEVERLCTLFGYLQQLVLTESTKPHLCATPIPPLLAFVADGASRSFKDAGMLLKAKIPNIRQLVFIDSARTHLALSSVLLVARAVSIAKDTIEMIASSSAGAVQIVVRNLNSSCGAMTPEERLSMGLAESCIRSQHGSFVYTPQPFSVEIELQGAAAGELDSPNRGHGVLAGLSSGIRQARREGVINSVVSMLT